MRHSVFSTTNKKPVLFYLVSGANRLPFKSLQQMIASRGINWFAKNIRQCNQRKLRFVYPNRTWKDHVYDFEYQGGNRLGEWTVENRRGEEIPLDFLLSLVSFKRPRHTWYCSGRKRKHYRIYREMRTSAERRAQRGFRYDQADVDENINGNCRIKGRKRKLPNSWDDEIIRSRHIRNWKKFRKTQYRRFPLLAGRCFWAIRR